MTATWDILMAVAFTPAALILLGLSYQERLARALVRWRYRVLSEPEETGWQAKANFGRKDPP